MNVLVCGGAGYIGSHMARWLAEHGHSVTVLDDLSTGHREAVRWGSLVVGSLGDARLLERLFSEQRFDVVMHFAARSLVAESMAAPYTYFRNNVADTLVLLEAMQRHGLDRLVFSSSAAVYGQPVADLIDEAHPIQPINPYGASKAMVERILADAASAYGLRSVSLRYFNAAGASPDGLIGESHQPETHLIPNVLRAALGSGPELQLFGDDYETVDGTCIRDYVHVDDLAQAHAQAIAWMQVHPGAAVFNLGSGSGYTVKQVIDVARQVSGRDITYRIMPRRAGDPRSLVAANLRAKSELGWVPRYQSLQDIVETAWRWHVGPRF